jgi:hypothetical protein
MTGGWADTAGYTRSRSRLIRLYEYDVQGELK